MCSLKYCCLGSKNRMITPTSLVSNNDWVERPVGDLMLVSGYYPYDSEKKCFGVVNLPSLPLLNVGRTGKVKYPAVW